MDALKNGNFSEAFDKLAQRVSEKPGEYGFAAAAAVSITLLLAVRSSKKKVRCLCTVGYNEQGSSCKRSPRSCI